MAKFGVSLLINGKLYRMTRDEYDEYKASRTEVYVPEAEDIIMATEQKHQKQQKQQKKGKSETHSAPPSRAELRAMRRIEESRKAMEKAQRPKRKRGRVVEDKDDGSQYGW